MALEDAVNMVQCGAVGNSAKEKKKNHFTNSCFLLVANR